MITGKWSGMEGKCEGGAESPSHIGAGRGCWDGLEELGAATSGARAGAKGGWHWAAGVMWNDLSLPHQRPPGASISFSV